MSKLVVQYPLYNNLEKVKLHTCSTKFKFVRK